jgi:CheY-like chemotaxis protein
VTAFTTAAQAAQRAAATGSHTAPAGSDMAEKRPYILLIDDDPDMHAVIELMLAPEGYDIVCCRTGAEGLERMRNERVPDVLLLDIMLGYPLEGLQIACQMRQDRRLCNVPIVFVSAVGQSVSEEQAREICPVALDADMFLEKPLDATTVREAVKWILEQKSGAD